MTNTSLNPLFIRSSIPFSIEYDFGDNLASGLNPLFIRSSIPLAGSTPAVLTGD